MTDSTCSILDASDLSFDKSADILGMETDTTFRYVPSTPILIPNSNLDPSDLAVSTRGNPLEVELLWQQLRGRKG